MERIEVGCAIIHKQGKLLIAQRHLKDSFGGYWEFPGGKREKDETIEACLVREVSEELGISILPERLFCQKEHGPNPIQFRRSGNWGRPDCHFSKKNKSQGGIAERGLSLFFFFCRWVSGDPQAIDCKDFRWISREELRQPVFLPGDTEVLEDLALHWEKYFKTGETCR